MTTNFYRVVFVLAAGLCGDLTLAADGGTAHLLIRTDLECKLTVDGKPGGVVRSGEAVTLNLPAGEHRVEAVPVAGSAHWEETVTLTGPDNQVLTVSLRPAVARAEAESHGYWTDPESHLMWAAADNGSGVTLSQAVYYCRFLTLGGHKDWTLPSIDDLQRLFGGPADQYGHHIKAPVKLTGWTWSSSPGKEAGEEWALDFGDGGRASIVTGDSGLNRALCVRMAQD